MTAIDFQPGDRIVYRDDEEPFAEHHATILDQPMCPLAWFEVQPDDVPDDTPWIHFDLIIGMESAA